MEEKVTIWYSVARWSNKVREIETIGETPKYLILKDKRYGGKNRREAKYSQYAQCFRTMEEALKHIHSRFTQEVRRAASNYEYTKDQLRKFQDEHPEFK